MRFVAWNAELDKPFLRCKWSKNATACHAECSEAFMSEFLTLLGMTTLVMLNEVKHPC